MLFTERIMQGMGGRGDTRGAAVEMTAAWSHAEHFELYDDALPTLETLRAARAEARAALEHRPRPAGFAAHHGLHADALLTSHAHGKEKPHATIFQRMLDLLDVAAGEAVMVGDTLEDDIDGARRDRDARRARRPRRPLSGRAAAPRDPAGAARRSRADASGAHQR